MSTPRQPSGHGAGRETAHLAQKLETLSTLAGGIAHDFNNLLVGMLAHSGLALKALAAPSPAAVATARENLEQVETAALEAADLAKKLLAFSGKAKLTTRPLDLARLLHDMAPQLRDAVTTNTELELNLTSQLPLVEADAAQIRQLMSHLVTNAADAVDDAGRVSIGTGIVELEDDEVEGYLPGPLSAGRYIYVTISDTGPGMDSTTLGKIFDPYFTTKSSGQGLGLAAVLGILHGHRGALRVESRPGEGSTFQVYFPCSPARAPVLGPAVHHAAPPSTVATVLVVDDDETVRKVTQKILESAGYGVRTARDGIEALAELREHGAEIALVVLDMRMPRMGGVETFQEMRRMVADLPIIVSSGYDPEDDDSAAIADQGSVVFLEKPYPPEDLTAKVSLLLDSARR